MVAVNDVSPARQGFDALIKNYPGEKLFVAAK